MKIKFLTLSVLLVSTATTVNAEITFQENKTSGVGYTQNMQIAPMDQDLELSKRFFSYDHNKIVFDHQYDAAKPLIDRLSMPEQTKIMIFWYGAALERELDRPYFDDNDVGTATLAEILKNSPYDTSGVNTLDEYNKFIRFALQDKMNKFLNVKLKYNVGQRFVFEVDNRTNHNLARLDGRLRVSQTKQDGQITYADYTVSTMAHAKRHDVGTFALNLDLNSSDFDLKAPLNFEFLATTISFLDRPPFNATVFYDQIQGNKAKFNSTIKSPIEK